MKAFRGTFLLSAFVVLLAGYTAWEYRKAGSDGGLTAQEKKLFVFEPDQAEQARILRGPETLLLVRTGLKSWKMKQPVEDDTEESAVEAFLYSIMIQKGKIFKGEDDAKTVKWADFGLEPPGSMIEITADKKVLSLQVSSKNAFDGSYYLRQGDDLLLGDHGLAQIIGRDFSSLRSRHLWREPDNTKAELIQVDLDLDGRKEKYSLKKVGDILVLDPKPAFAVDTLKLDQWLGVIYNLNPSEIVGDSLSDEQKKNELLLKPSLALRVQFKKPDGSSGQWNLTVGQDRGDDVFMYTNQRPTVYKTKASSLKTLRLGTEFFRDGKKAFVFSVEQAHEIQIRNGATQHTLVKDGSAWKVKEPNLEVNGAKLATFLQNLSSLEAQNFPEAKLAKGFKPDQEIMIRDSQGQTLLDLKWGDEFKAQEPWNKGMTFRFTQTNLEKSLMGVNAGKIMALVDPGLVVPKAAETGKK